ncbi:MAG: hypothetical protein V2B15_01775 [Bacteroidota bacterium]
MMVSGLKKTIVDIAIKPRFCGGIIEVGNAIFMAKTRTDHDKLFYYFASKWYHMTAQAVCAGREALPDRKIIR